MVGAAHLKGVDMATLDLRAYERLIGELAGDAKLSTSQRELLQDHRREVTQLRMLSAPEAVNRDARQVRAWIEGEWSRLGDRIPRRTQGRLQASL